MAFVHLIHHVVMLCNELSLTLLIHCALQHYTPPMQSWTMT